MNKDKIIEFLAKVCECDIKTVSELPNDALLSEIEFESLKFISFIVMVEEAFDIEVNDSDLLLSNFETKEKIFASLEKYFLPQSSSLKKCLILDCDNVLWKGISGEESITIDDDVLKLHSLLNDLYERGVLLCLCSKNDEQFIDQSFSDSRINIKNDIFISSKINREPKHKNITDIANELNLSLDSFVFADDSDYELGFINSALPDVKTVKVDYSDKKFIDEIAEYFADYKNKDELNRTELYKEQKEREKIRQSAMSAEEYNSTLETKITCGIADKKGY